MCHLPLLITRMMHFSLPNFIPIYSLHLKIPGSFVHLILLDRFWFVHIPFGRMDKLQFLAQFPVDHQSCIVLCSSCANLLHLLIMWLIVSSLSPNNIHLRFCCVLSIFSFIWLVRMALYCAAIRRDSFYVLKFLFLSHIKVFLREVSLVYRFKYPYNCFSSYFYLSVNLYVVGAISGRFLRSFLCSLRVLISMYRRYLQCWRVLYILLCMTHIISLCHLSDVMLYASFLFFLFSCPFVEALPLSRYYYHYYFVSFSHQRWLWSFT